MRDLNKRFGIIFIICISLVTLITFITAFVALASDPGVNCSDSVQTVSDYSEGWYNTSKVKVRINEFTVVPDKLSVETPFVLTKKIERKDLGKDIFIRTRYLTVNVYIDGERAHFTAENGSVKNLPGFDDYIFVSVPHDAEGKEIKLEIFKNDYSLGLCINCVKIGPGRLIMRELLAESLIGLVSGVVGAALGIALIALGIFTRKSLKTYLSSIFFGVFLLFMSLSIIFDTSWVHIVINNTYFNEKAMRAFLCAAMPAFLAFVDSFYDTDHYYPVKVLTIASSVVVCGFLVLDIFGVFSFIYIGLFVHIFMIICGGVSSVELILFMIHVRSKLPLRRIDYIAVIQFWVFGLIDICMYYGWSGGNDDLIFTRLGLLILTAVTVFSRFEEILEMTKLGIQAGKIGKIAFTDANTGINNVAAFKAKFDDLESKKSNYKFIGVIQFDVNNLKIVNDSKGHEAGDYLIKSAADIINDSFGKQGTCYRTGGDEFVALVTGEHAPIICEEAIYRFNKAIDKFNDNPDKPFELRIAYGIAYYEQGKTEGLTLKEIHKMADERMYSNKKMLKARYAKSPEEAVVR